MLPVLVFLLPVLGSWQGSGRKWDMPQCPRLANA